MDAQLILPAIIAGLVGGVPAAIVAITAIRVELRWLRRDVDLAHERISQLDRRQHHAQAQTHQAP